MPTYEYRCTQCTRHIEAQQSFSDAPLQRCEFCGGKLRRIFSPVGVMFKGSGFYSTDARSDARASARKSDAQSSNGEKPADQKKTDSGAKDSKGKQSSSAAPEPSAAGAKRTKRDKKT